MVFGCGKAVIVRDRGGDSIPVFVRGTIEQLAVASKGCFPHGVRSVTLTPLPPRQ